MGVFDVEDIMSTSFSTKLDRFVTLGVTAIEVLRSVSISRLLILEDLVLTDVTRLFLSSDPVFVARISLCSFPFLGK